MFANCIKKIAYVFPASVGEKHLCSRYFVSPAKHSAYNLHKSEKGSSLTVSFVLFHNNTWLFTWNAGMDSSMFNKAALAGKLAIQHFSISLQWIHLPFTWTRTWWTSTPSLEKSLFIISERTCMHVWLKRWLSLPLPMHATSTMFSPRIIVLKGTAHSDQKVLAMHCSTFVEANKLTTSVLNVAKVCLTLPEMNPPAEDHDSTDHLRCPEV